MLSTQSILQELNYLSVNSTDVLSFIESANSLLDSVPLSEAQYDKVTEHLRLEILDVERFVQVNNCKAITNPRAFIRDSIPSDDGLLSNSIFGITKDERAGIFAYIDLHGWFMDPSCYKTWIRMDSKVRNIVHGIGTYRINDLGEIVEDPKGKTGIDFLRNNLSKIKFKSTDSIKRDIKINYLEQNRNSTPA